jgi:Golgi nucleoside diphosphatase
MHQFSSEDVKKFLVIIICITYTIRSLFEIYSSKQELKRLKREYTIKLNEYCKLRDERVDKALEFSSTLQVDLDRLKSSYSYMSREEQIMFDDIQLQLDKYRAKIIISNNIIKL